MALQKSKRLKASPSVQYPWRLENLIIGALDCNSLHEYSFLWQVWQMRLEKANMKLIEMVYLFGASLVNINPLFPVEIWEKGKWV